MKHIVRVTLFFFFFLNLCVYGKNHESGNGVTSQRKTNLRNSFEKNGHVWGDSLSEDADTEWVVKNITVGGNDNGDVKDLGTNTPGNPTPERTVDQQDEASLGTEGHDDVVSSGSTSTKNCDCTEHCPNTCKESDCAQCKDILKKECSEQCAQQCTDQCAQQCTDQCAQQCTDQCTDHCADQCGDHCDEHCTENCDQQCVDNCADHCTETCDNQCVDNCDQQCADKCDQQCGENCVYSKEECCDDCDVCKKECEESCKRETREVNPDQQTEDSVQAGGHIPTENPEEARAQHPSAEEDPAAHPPGEEEREKSTTVEVPSAPLPNQEGGANVDPNPETLPDPQKQEDLTKSKTLPNEWENKNILVDITKDEDKEETNEEESVHEEKVTYEEEKYEIDMSKHRMEDFLEGGEDEEEGDDGENGKGEQDDVDEIKMYDNGQDDGVVAPYGHKKRRETPLDQHSDVNNVKNETEILLENLLRELDDNSNVWNELKNLTQDLADMFLIN
ncbi:N2227-like protein, putative [Plasmodium ovale wallikeri]|uniref:N2227-like protein, putative n=1 Tax=Plasmodium ovale wallikeri TaxID=864142 RepID=A0A1A8YNH7_PLAOA|nr:N2227-like protein, putative [Plasmodium ovale wallikeri]